MTSLPFSYIQEFYSVPACIGRRVVVYGKPGIIVKDCGHYIGVNFDHERPGMVREAHPTSEVHYLGMGKIRPMSSSQRRYQDYLGVADLYDGFGHYLRSLSARSGSGRAHECETAF